MTRTTKECRAGKSCEPTSLGEAAMCLLMHSAMPIEQIAARVRKSESYLRKAANADYEELHLQADTLLAATLVTGNLVALQFIARECNAAVIPLPVVAAEETPELVAAFMRTTKELGDVSEALERALKGDRAIDAAERRQVIRQIDEHIEAAVALKQLVIATAKGPR